MNIRAAICLGAALLLSGVGWSQNRLGDVADSITLNPDAIVEKKGFVEDPNAAVKADQRLFSDYLASCSAAAANLGGLVEEARNTVLYRDDDLPNRLTAAALDLDTQMQELYLLRLAPSFDEPVDTAAEAVDLCATATDSTRAELARKGVRFVDAAEDVAACRQRLGLAEAQLAAVGSGGGAGPSTAPPGSEAPSARTDDEIVAEACEPEGSGGQDAVDACGQRQYQALAAITSRTADNEMIDPSVFLGIRGVCAELHPLDFVRRDSCEVEKMTAVRLEAE